MDLFPPIEPHAWGMLDVGCGHELYWEVSGNPTGMPVVFLHGGPGAGTAPAHRRFFDPTFWRIVLFDQRGCGRSIPQACIQDNTTAHLVADMEALRCGLGIERWLVFGGSWGSTLALAYGEAWPERCLGFVLRGVFLFRAGEVDWFLTGMGRFYPEAAKRFEGFLSSAPQSPGGMPPLPLVPAPSGAPAFGRNFPHPNEFGRSSILLQAYYRRLTDPDPAVHQPAARAWCAYEEACARLLPRSDTAEAAAGALLAMARIEAHYMMRGGFLEPDQLLAGLSRIHRLPAMVVQGRYDVICPPATALDLTERWPNARLIMVPDAGHSAMEPGTRVALTIAVERMKPMCR